jgi:hypothetical protein
MRFRTIAVAVLMGSSVVTSALAQHSTLRGSDASVGASVVGGLSAAWIAYEGSEFVVLSARVAGNGIELSLKGVSNGVETSAFVAREVSVGVGTSVKVVAESTGYALTAAGRVIAFVPNEIARSLLHHSRH